MKSESRILLLADYGPRIGGGHAMRCLTLGAALAERGARVAMSATGPMRQALAPFWPEAVEALAVQAMLPQAPSLAESWRADLTVVDHYRAEARFEAALRAAGSQVAAINDLADRAHAAALVVDPSFERRAEDYAKLAPGARVLAGPAYALVRTGFAERRAAALTRRGGPAERVLLALGLTDVGGVTAQAAQALLPILGERRLDIVVGSGAESLAGLQKLAAADSRIQLHIDAADMARLTAEADLAVGAGGSSVWERACLGLPSLILVLADNQAAQARALADAGASLTLDARAPDFEAGLAAALDGLLSNAPLRRHLGEASAALCDGQGAGRVADAILELTE